MEAIVELIERLEKSPFGGVGLDETIGLAAGWHPRVDYVKHYGDAAAKRNVVWLVPNGEESKLPTFSTSFDAAVLVANSVAPDQVWGVIFQNGRARAIVGDNSYSEAATPELALCAAALRYQLDHGSGS